MQTLTTARLELQPLVVAHADAMFSVLSDATLYRHLDSAPHPSVEHTRDVYARLEARQSPDGLQRWLNWVVVPHGRSPIGFVQATIPAGRTAWLAYLVSAGEWGRGYATEAVVAMKAHLADAYGIERFLATVEADHARSIALLFRVGLRPATDEECTAYALTSTERLFVG